MPVKDCRGMRRMSAGARAASSTAQLPITSFREHSFDQEYGGIDAETGPEHPAITCVGLPVLEGILLVSTAMGTQSPSSSHSRPAP
jgi:hypothetical protein